MARPHPSLDDPCLSAMLALALLVVLGGDWAAGPHLACLAQMAPPLQGQGLDPFTSFQVANPVPIYMTVQLLKLLHLDEHEYQFTALVKFQQSWEDPRSAALFQLIEEASFMYNVAQTRAVSKCAPVVDGLMSNADFSNMDFSLAILNKTNFTNCGSAHPVQAPPCTKYCTFYGSGGTDNPFRCCDAVWLPGVDVRNLLDMSQDRVVSDVVWGWGTNGVHRETQVLGRFSTPLGFKAYPFDSQTLQILFAANMSPSLYQNEKTFNTTGNGSFVPPYYIVPSATIRSYNGIIKGGEVDTSKATLNNQTADELAGWKIQNVTLTCASLPDYLQGNPLTSTTQDFSSGDGYADYSNSSKTNPTTLLPQMCALSVSVSRLSNTAVVSTIIPVLFICLLAFVVFFTAPNELDTRLGTGVTLFLALTAVQFIFVSQLPLTSYITSFDVLILMSYTLIVVIVLENLVVAYISTRAEHKEKVSIDVTGSGTKNGPTKEAGSEEEEEAQPSLAEDKRKTLSLMHSAKSLEPFTETLAKDPKGAYRLACWIDVVTGFVLALTYCILVIVNFTRGLV